MHVESSRLARVRAHEASPALFLALALAALGTLYLVVTTGAVVRLTASGLGCENWPRCGDTPFPEKNGHALIEFSNRVVALVTMGCTLAAWLAARRVRSLPRPLVWLSLAVFLGTFAQIPLGGLTVIFELHPLLVMAHFLLALAVLAVAVVAVLEAWSFLRGRAAPLAPPALRRLGLMLAAACLVLVVTGAFATAAGPHPGGEDIRRLGSLPDAVAVHVRAAAAFGIGFLVLLGYLAAHRARTPILFRSALVLLALLLAQMAVGEIQWRAQLPWWLVLVHVSLAAAIWAGTVGLVAALWRPPAPLARA